MPSNCKSFFSPFAILLDFSMSFIWEAILKIGKIQKRKIQCTNDGDDLSFYF